MHGCKNARVLNNDDLDKCQSILNYRNWKHSTIDTQKNNAEELSGVLKSPPFALDNLGYLKSALDYLAFHSDALPGIDPKLIQKVCSYAKEVAKDDQQVLINVAYISKVTKLEAEVSSLGSYGSSTRSSTSILPTDSSTRSIGTIISTTLTSYIHQRMAEIQAEMGGGANKIKINDVKKVNKAVQEQLPRLLFRLENINHLGNGSLNEDLAGRLADLAALAALKKMVPSKGFREVLSKISKQEEDRNAHPALERGKDRPVVLEAVKIKAPENDIISILQGINPGKYQGLSDSKQLSASVSGAVKSRPSLGDELSCYAKNRNGPSNLVGKRRVSATSDGAVSTKNTNPSSGSGHEVDNVFLQKILSKKSQEKPLSRISEGSFKG